MKIEVFGAKRRAEFEAGIRALEEGVSYPLGDDRFEIDHGADYFAFFDRLGELTQAVCIDNGELIALGAGVLREVELSDRTLRCWYLCDFKVRRSHRGQRIPLKMLTRAFPLNYARCGRGYAITMNPKEGDNPVVRLAKRFSLAPVRVAATLVLYSLDAEAMRAFEPTLRAHRGPLSYLSLAGKKDIVLQSTGEAMPLLHVQFGPCADEGSARIVDGAEHMFACVEGDSLHQAAQAAELTVNSSASVIDHRMGDVDYGFVLTSDI